jgi:DNA-binding transcriptional ArsR family regulator
MEVKTAVTTLTALAQETRLRIFRLLVQADPTGLAAGQIAEKLGIPSATLTFHLKELSRAGLIDSEREGRWIRYSLRIGVFSIISDN